MSTGKNKGIGEQLVSGPESEAQAKMIQEDAKGLKALVTGGSRGIGRGIAFALAERGFDLVISHWNDEEVAQTTSDRIRREYGRSCTVFEGNLEEEHEPQKLAEAAIHTLGRIDVLVNNAGITLFKGIHDIDLRHTNRLLHLNFYMTGSTLRLDGGLILPGTPH